MLISVGKSLRCAQKYLQINLEHSSIKARRSRVMQENQCFTCFALSLEIFPKVMQRVHAGQIILSFGLYQLNRLADFSHNDTLSNIIGMYLVMFCSSALINSSWIITNVTISRCQSQAYFTIHANLTTMLTNK